MLEDIKPMLKNALVILALAAAAPSIAQSANYGMLIAKKNTPEVNAYMQGLLDGVFAITGQNNKNGIKGTFCPGEVVIKRGDLEVMVHDVAKSMPPETRNSTPLWGLAVVGLTVKYPCS